MTGATKLADDPDLKESSASYATPALEKGLDILELLAHERDGLTKSEVARGLGRTVSEIFRMLVCLERRGYISQTSRDRYVLSLRLFQLVQEHPPTERLMSEALPRMHNLVEIVQQSCHLGVLEAGKVVVLAQSNAPGSMGFYVKPGASVDLMESSTGHVILAHLPRDARQRMLDEWKSETGGKIPADLSRHLERIRRRGYEKRASYQVRGVTNISYPIRDAEGRAVAAITVPYINRVNVEPDMAHVEQSLARTARDISSALGAH